VIFITSVTFNIVNIDKMYLHLCNNSVDYNC
jgi:hypothetical protein